MGTVTVDGDIRRARTRTDSADGVVAASALRLAGYSAYRSPWCRYRLGNASCGRPDGPSPAATAPAHPPASEACPDRGQTPSVAGSGESPLIEIVRRQWPPAPGPIVTVLSVAGHRISA